MNNLNETLGVYISVLNKVFIEHVQVWQCQIKVVQTEAPLFYCIIITGINKLQTVHEFTTVGKLFISHQITYCSMSSQPELTNYLI